MLVKYIACYFLRNIFLFFVNVTTRYINVFPFTIGRMDCETYRTRNAIKYAIKKLWQPELTFLRNTRDRFHTASSTFYSIQGRHIIRSLHSSYVTSSVFLRSLSFPLNTNILLTVYRCNKQPVPSLDSQNLWGFRLCGVEVFSIYFVVYYLDIRGVGLTLRVCLLVQLLLECIKHAIDNS